MSWMIVVLLPKGGGNFRGIGLLDPFWKVVEKVMVCRLGSIEFHPCLHGGLPKRGAGMATIEAKLAQQLAWIEQEPLYQVFIDLRKAYDHLDWERCLAIMTRYGVGPKLLHLQTNSGSRRRWSVELGVVLGNRLAPTVMLLRVARSPPLCLMFVLMR
jgi:hypothetical protein